MRKRTTKSKAVCPVTFLTNNVEQRCGCPGARTQTDCSQPIAAGNDEGRETDAPSSRCT